MKNWLTNLLAPRRKPAPPEPGTGLAGGEMEVETLRVQQENQTARMELQAREEKIENLRQEIEWLRARQEQLLVERLDSRLGALFADLSAPASQILTQAYLLEEEQKPVQARDVLTVARRLTRALERHGLVFDGQFGEQVAFDPGRHAPLGAGEHPKAGQPVTVRFAGTSYAGKIITKAGVEG
jgi:molecular chaperone GrpE (heat shock protein)